MKIKILQWNIWVKENHNNIVKELRRINADIVCTQELIQNSKTKLDVTKYIAKRLNYYYFFQAAETWDNRDEKNTQGNAIFSKYSIIGKYYKYVQKPIHNPSDAMHEGRVYVEATVKINNKRITLGTTHLSYSHRFEIDNRRKKEANILFDIIRTKNKNYIFTGDLNTAQDSYIVNKLGKILQPAGPNYYKKTWTTKPFEYLGFKEDKLRWRLDYVFASHDIKVVNSKIIKTKCSDHLPILAEIEI